MPHIEYYGLRRVNPYLGVLQVIDAGAVRAYSSDGKTWRPRRVYDSERFWSNQDQDFHTHQEISKNAMINAIKEHPPVPFPLGDCFELWLLSKSTLLPLALLRTCHWRHDVHDVEEVSWRPFIANEYFDDIAGWSTGETPKKSLSHRDYIERLINDAAQPLPAAQWFQRHADGSGTGLGGLRVNGLENRRLPEDSFPELLISEQWDHEDDCTHARLFHDWHAALLLAHQNISTATRLRLERAMQKRPDKLCESYPFIPEIIDHAAMRVALVSARLIQAAS